MVIKNVVPFLEYLMHELQPDLKNFKRDDPIPFCLKKRLYLMNYIRYFPGKVQKSHGISLNLLQCAECNAGREGLTFASSIRYAPENSLALAAAYVKRSEWLLNENDLEEANIDAVRALKCYMNVINFPIDLCEEIRIMIRSGKSDEAEKLLTYASRSVSTYPAEELCNIQAEILMLLKLNDKGDTSNYRDYAWQLPQLKYGENLNFPSSSNSLRVQYSKEKGRHVVAKCFIDKGDVLFVEKPFSFVPHKSNSETLHCENCYSKTKIGIGCPYCMDVWYCCEKCGENDWELFHKYECGYLDFLNHTGIGRLALRTILQAAPSIDELKKVIDELKKRETNSNTVFSKFNYENVYNLLTHAEDVEIEDLLHYSLAASLLSLYLIHFTDYASRTEENVEFCAKLFLHHMMQIVSNAHYITGADKDIVHIVEQHGSGIYPSVSMMNHSCEPSVINIFQRSCMIVRARKAIQEGEEIFSSYGAHHLKMKRSLRQKILKEQYCFDCKCSSCCMKFDPYDIFNSDKCTKCYGPVTGKTEENGSTEPGNKVCLFCWTIYTSPPDQPEGIQLMELFLQGNYILDEEGDYSEALKVFLKVWKITRDRVFALHEDLLVTAKRIIDCLFGLKDFESCLKLWTCCVMHLVQRFGEYSLEAATERLRFHTLYNYYLPERRESTLQSKSYKIFQNTWMFHNICKQLLGYNHPMTQLLVEDGWR